MTPTDDQSSTPTPISVSEITSDMTAEPPPPHHSVVSRLRNYFLTGLILVGPIYITINLTWWFITWVDDAMRPFIPVGLRAETYLPFRIPGYGVIVALFALTLLGFLTANLVGRTLVEFSDNLLNRMPIVRPIYKTMKQIFETLFSKSGSSFRRVGPGRIPDRHVVAGVPVAAAEPGHGAQPAGTRLRRRLPAVHAQSDHRLLLLRAAQGRDRSRHLGRSGHDADHVGRHGAAERGDAQKKLSAIVESARASRMTTPAAPAKCRRSNHPARISRTASSRSNR